MSGESFQQRAREPMRALRRELRSLSEDERVDALNWVRAELSKLSPLRHHPVDCVQWVAAKTVYANDYNPNTVAPPEMRLLEHSVLANGYTMPIVAHRVDDDEVLVVDGFHRQKVGRSVPEVRDSLRGRLPVTFIRASRRSKNARIAATVEHNRARGEHSVTGMSRLVSMLYEAGWRDDKIRQELGLDPDELLRLKQVTGLATLFEDREFSRAWEPAT